MEQHPVPQNVTTFQFRLVGDMTLKQFGYLATGVVLAYIATKLPLPFFFTWPMALFFALGGFGLAFVPVEERPMDIWFMSFLRNTYAPTQYVWQKVMQEKPKTVPVKAVPSPPIKAPAPSLLSRLYTPPQSQPAPAPAPSSFSVSEIHRPDPLGWLRSRLKTSLSVKPHVSYPNVFAHLNLPPIVRKLSPPAPPPTPKAPIPSPQPTHQPTVAPHVQVAATQKQQVGLAAELARLAPHPPQQAALKTTMQPSIHTIGSDAAVAAGLPKLTTFPNVVTGIIKDDRGNLLAGALVTVRDTNGVPLRALKTNKVGQFAASTPLPNGTYIVEIEDPQGRYAFDRAQISVAGAVLPALEIMAKTKKQIEREKLTKAIFGD